MTTLNASVPFCSTLPLYQNNSTKIEIAQHPLSIRSVDIKPKSPSLLSELNEENLYAKLRSNESPVWQVTAYANLPNYLDHCVTRKIYSIWQQTKVLFRTIFPVKRMSEEFLARESSFWDLNHVTESSSVGQKNGQGALTSQEVIDKQMVFPNSMPDKDNEILLLYNYAPLRTGGEQMHFLLVPNPAKPAKNFLELDKEQYTHVLALAQKVALWAEGEFKEEVVMHFFDKTGKIAGQTQPLFYAHLILVRSRNEERWGRVAMFFRMFFPVTPLSRQEVAKRVTHYKSSLGEFLASHIES
ncbi:MAG: hypothetical protein R3E91_05380 [Chlamydiales bacterium]